MDPTPEVQAAAAGVVDGVEHLFECVARLNNVPGGSPDLTVALVAFEELVDFAVEALAGELAKILGVGSPPPSLMLVSL